MHDSRSACIDPVEVRDYGHTVKLTFHDADTDTDILARILDDTSDTCAIS